jgi:hypothetical protein
MPAQRARVSIAWATTFRAGTNSIWSPSASAGSVRTRVWLRCVCFVSSTRVWLTFRSGSRGEASGVGRGQARCGACVCAGGRGGAMVFGGGGCVGVATSRRALHVWVGGRPSSQIKKACAQNRNYWFAARVLFALRLICSSHPCCAACEAEHAASGLALDDAVGLCKSQAGCTHFTTYVSPNREEAVLRLWCDLVHRPPAPCNVVHHVRVRVVQPRRRGGDPS